MAKSVRYEGERDAKVESKDTLKMFKAAQELGQAAPEVGGLVTMTPHVGADPIDGEELARWSQEEHNAALGLRPPLTQEEKAKIQQIENSLGEGFKNRSGGGSGSA